MKKNYFLQKSLTSLYFPLALFKWMGIKVQNILITSLPFDSFLNHDFQQNFLQLHLPVFFATRFQKASLRYGYTGVTREGKMEVSFCWYGCQQWREGLRSMWKHCVCWLWLRQCDLGVSDQFWDAATRILYDNPTWDLFFSFGFSVVYGLFYGLWRRKWQPTPVLLPGKSHRRRSLVGYSPCGHKELDTTERLHFHGLF